MQKPKATCLQISLIVAVAENGVIGAKGELPWKLSSDLKTFRRLTLGKPVIMGRKTFQSLGKPLDGRENIVLTTDPFFEVPGVSVVDSMQDAMTLARTLAATSGTNEIMVIGGAGVLQAALPPPPASIGPRCTPALEGDVRFPALELGDWHEVSREALPRAQGHRDRDLQGARAPKKLALISHRNTACALNHGPAKPMFMAAQLRRHTGLSYKQEPQPRVRTIAMSCQAAAEIRAFIQKRGFSIHALEQSEWWRQRWRRRRWRLERRRRSLGPRPRLSAP